MTPSTKSRTKPKPKPVAGEWRFSAIGTEWWISIREPLDDADMQRLKQLAGARIERFDAAYSRFRPDSLVTRMSRHAGVYRLPADSRALFALYRKLYDATDGAVTPLIGDLLAAAGYDADYSLQPGQLHTPLPWDTAISYADGILTVKRPVMLDFGAAGKGYLVDLVAEAIRAQGIESFCIDAGGDLLVRGPEALRVGLEHPDDEGRVIGVAALTGRALAGSAGNRRAWAGYHHIMNPFTLNSPAEPKAVWVAADTALLADGLTTALCFVPPERLSQFDFEYLIVNSKGRYKRSPGFPAEVF
jgi:thiamine biosynthesis lipoprotein